MPLPLATYVPLTLALVVTPGATTAVVVRNAVDGGWRAGVAAASGAALGSATHATAAAVGLAVLFERWPEALTALRYGGALYLAWLAADSLRRAATSATPFAARVTGASSTRGAWRQGLTVNLLNPPIIVFYLAVVPTFVPAGGGLIAFATLAAIHLGLAFTCHTGWALAFDSNTARQLFESCGVFCRKHVTIRSTSGI
jgi:threonine/homoserine/homoserine lactone efflux protein